VVVVELPAASALPLSIGLGFEVGILAAAANLIIRAANLFIGLRDGGPLALSWAGPPIRARGQRISWPLGQLVEINSNKNVLPCT